MDQHDDLTLTELSLREASPSGEVDQATPPPPPHAAALLADAGEATPRGRRRGVDERSPANLSPARPPQRPRHDHGVAGGGVEAMVVGDGGAQHNPLPWAAAALSPPGARAAAGAALGAAMPQAAAVAEGGGEDGGGNAAAVAAALPQAAAAAGGGGEGAQQPGAGAAAADPARPADVESVRQRLDRLDRLGATLGANRVQAALAAAAGGDPDPAIVAKMEAARAGAPPGRPAAHARRVAGKTYVYVAIREAYARSGGRAGRPEPARPGGGPQPDPRAQLSERAFADEDRVLDFTADDTPFLNAVMSPTRAALEAGECIHEGTSYLADHPALATELAAAVRAGQALFKPVCDVGTFPLASALRLVDRVLALCPPPDVPGAFTAAFTDLRDQVENGRATRASINRTIAGLDPFADQAPGSLENPPSPAGDLVLGVASAPAEYTFTAACAASLVSAFEGAMLSAAEMGEEMRLHGLRVGDAALQQGLDNNVGDNHGMGHIFRMTSPESKFGVTRYGSTLLDEFTKAKVRMEAWARPDKVVDFVRAALEAIMQERGLVAGTAVHCDDITDALVVHFPTQVAEKWGVPDGRPPDAYVRAVREKVHDTMKNHSSRPYGDVGAAAEAARRGFAAFHYDANTRMARLWRISPANAGGRPRANRRPRARGG